MTDKPDKMNPVQIEWKRVLYNVMVEDKEAPHSILPCVNLPMKEKTILNTLSGYVAPGKMLAIMGPSGSGKTTLLNVLAGRINRKNWQGEVLINNQPADRSVLKVVAGYVPQDDILYGSQTVFEALMFYAKLKLPHLSDEEKTNRVNHLIEELGLVKVAHSIIGFVGAEAAASGLQRGISGGERKRTSIGCQLIADPALLFLDEPTTGLDSFAAEAVIRVLSRQLQAGRTIIFTIHQPSNDILKLFDELLIIAHGRTVYFGPQAKALKYFSSIGYPCSADENPADHFVEVIHREKKKPSQRSMKRKETVHDSDNSEHSEIDSTDPPSPYYIPSPPSKKQLRSRSSKSIPKQTPKAHSPTKQDEEEESGGDGSGSGGDGGGDDDGEANEKEKLKSKEEPKTEEKKVSPEERVIELAKAFSESRFGKLFVPQVPKGSVLPPLRRASTSVQFRELFRRNAQQVIRDPGALKAGVVQNVIIAIIMGIIYLQLGYDQAGIQDRAGALFFGALFVMFGGIMSPLSLFAVERKQFLFQYMEALYTPSVYYVSKVIPEILPLIFTSFIFSSIFYWMLGLRPTADHFLIFWAFALLLIVCAQSFAFFFAGAVPDLGILMTLFPIVFLPQMIFSGFYLNSSSTPVYFIWVEYLSLIKYSFQALCRNEFEGEAFYCNPTELASSKGVCPYTIGDEWLRFRSLDTIPIYGNALIMIMFTLAYHFGGFYFTRKRAISSTK